MIGNYILVMILIHLKFLIVDDPPVNEFYIKEEKEESKQIIVKPYGQPFMEISLLFFKK